MFFKIAFSNVKRSMRDYTVYFLTLMVGICIFYVFNSMDSQEALLVVTKSQSSLIKSATAIIGYVSVFVSVILGFLILYANKFLIRRRKKELGIYMLLGMPKGKISRVLVMETAIIGLVSLAVGLCLGIFLSQGLSVVTARMFAVDMKQFQFVFSIGAFVKSLVYFGVIYLIVMVFNVLTISRCKLIDLINAQKKNEKLHVRSLWLSVLLFVISVVCLAAAYQLILENGMLIIDWKFKTCIVLGIIGTFLFFLSLSGFLLRVVKTSKKIYYKNLNMFVLRQLNSKINTAFISMTVICLMLLCTIGALTTGMGLSQSMTKDLKYLTPFGGTMTANENQIRQFPDTVAQLRADGVEVDRFIKDMVSIDTYQLEDVTYQQVMCGMENAPTDKVTADALARLAKRPAEAYTLSEYNAVMRRTGRPEVVLADGEFCMNANNEKTTPYLQQFFEAAGEITVNGRVYHAAGAFRQDPVANDQFRNETGALILPDSALAGKEPVVRRINFDYIGDTQSEEAFYEQFEAIYPNRLAGTVQFPLSRQTIYDQSMGTSTLVSYLAVYVGIVFLLTCAAVLALQQLSESSDNTERYGLLRRLGAEEKQINRALFTQILIYFMVPLVLAVIHSVVGVKVANDVVEVYGKINIAGNIMIIAGLFLIVYGGYFLATYFGSRNMIRARK